MADAVRSGLTWVRLGKHVFVQEVPERGEKGEISWLEWKGQMSGLSLVPSLETASGPASDTMEREDMSLGTLEQLH